MLTQYFTKNLLKGITLVTLALSLGACRKFVSIGPPTTSMVQETVFKDARTTAAALKQAYFAIAGITYNGNMASISLLNALYPDEYRLTSTHIGLSMMYTNSPDPVESMFSNMW